MLSINYAFWKETVNTEIEFLKTNDTWNLCDFPPRCKTIRCKWILKEIK